MDKQDLEQLLSDVAGGAVTPAVALARIQTAPTADLGFAQLDLSRGVRQGAGDLRLGKFLGMREQAVQAGDTYVVEAVDLVAIELGRQRGFFGDG